MPPVVIGEGITAYFIKYYAIISAGGYAAPPMFVLEVDGMVEDTLNVVKVQGLGLSVEVTNFGYVLWCKSRALNTAVYEWIFDVVTLDFIASIKLAHKPPMDQKHFQRKMGNKPKSRYLKSQRQSWSMKKKMLFMKTPATYTEHGNSAVMGKLKRKI